MATAVVREITAEGVLKIVLRGDVSPLDACSVLQYPSQQAASAALLGRTVLVLVQGTALPVVLGVVHQRVWDEPTEQGGEGRTVVQDKADTLQARLPAGQPVSVYSDKRRLDLDAAEEIRLTCGKSLLVLRRDGTVIVRGVRIVSRASESNKIRGATVNIN
jgi:hypothetical protein